MSARLIYAYSPEEPCSVALQSNCGNTSRVDALCGVVLEVRNIDDLIFLVAHLRQMTTAHELEILQILLSMLNVGAVLMMNGKQDSLDDSRRSVFQILEFVDVLVTTPGIIASVGHLEDAIKQAFTDALANETGVDE